MIGRNARHAAPGARIFRATLAADLAAIAALATALTCPGARAADAPSAAQGAAAFQANCAVCHGPAGAGVPGLAPPITS